MPNTGTTFILPNNGFTKTTRDGKFMKWSHGNVCEEAIKVCEDLKLKLARLQIYLEEKLKATVDLGTKNSLHRDLKAQILKEAIRVA